MNYDKADFSDPLLKTNVKNFGAPKPGSQRPLPPGIRKQRYDKIIPVMAAKKTFQEFHESAWQRKEGKNKTGGLNEKGRKSYERENPGSDLKAPQPGGGPRKRSFCARMGGVKGPMKDEKGRPTRKALALRKWKC